MFSAVSSALYSQTVTSPYLLNPDLAVGYVDSCAHFWFKAYDSVQGGFYMNIDRMGNLISSWGTGKNTLNQSRDAYGFFRGYMLTGKPEYLTYARRALSFLYRSGWDTTYGGWYADISKNGAPSSPGANKTAYYQHYAILGIAASLEVTDDSTDRAMLMRSLAHNDAHFWDSSPQSFGYYDNTLANGTQPSGKSFNATVDAVTTHLLHLYLMTGDSTYLTRLRKVADNMVNRLAASAYTQAIGFVEGYDTYWSPLSSDSMTIMGHVLKTAWCLGRLYEFVPDTSYLGTAKRLVDMVLVKGYDHQNGGPYKDYSRVTGNMLMWGQRDTAKAWWQMEQAVNAGLVLYHLTGDSKYLSMADETLKFFMTYFVDHTYGEVYENRTKYGAQIWDTNKGSSGKAAYHSTELGYYVYLYGNLLLKGSRATLHYAFSPVNHVRQIHLAPIEFHHAGVLGINGVTLNDTVYHSYDGYSSVLSIPAGIGGHFAVTFGTSPGPDAVAERADPVPGEMRLEQNYPNPFNPSTSIRYTVGVASLPAGQAGSQSPVTSNVRMVVYDLLGREVAVLVNEPKQPGEYTITWNATGAASGVYFYSLDAGNYREVKRMVLLK
jgi:mannose/cellobiose epimerase-like protein (N-acyl-D-glucosamine 2-epimerase family)